MLKRLLLGLVVLWSGVSLAVEARRAATSWDARAEWEMRPDDWRLGSPPVARLESCLAAARRLVPRGSTVAFATSGEPPESSLLYTRWAAYLMPALNVLSYGEAPAQYVLSWHVPLAGPRLVGLQPAGHLPGCFLYKASRP
ncbi:MAG TPA: hypothetical protein VGS07_17985 [Thermoanaerobaculia bacterium]|jgi:hypothetical protein|nr:hypothetical protein [Thermoanaerobaculia bacterium]